METTFQNGGGAFLRPEEAALRLSMTTQAVYRLIRGRRIPACKIDGKSWRVPARALDEYIAAKTSESMAALTPSANTVA